MINFQGIFNKSVNLRNARSFRILFHFNSVPDPGYDLEKMDPDPGPDLQIC